MEIRNRVSTIMLLDRSRFPIAFTPRIPISWLARHPWLDGRSKDRLTIQIAVDRLQLSTGQDAMLTL
eukprot:scaffold265310_cov27-Prasinocladus_malaysianus.AAC.1